MPASYKYQVSRNWLAAVLIVALPYTLAVGAMAHADDVLAPLVQKGKPVDWWFAFKFNAEKFSHCAAGAQRACIFGGKEHYSPTYSQQFVYASSADPVLRDGSDCLGDAIEDPVGATFDQVYNGTANYVLWNDQFYQDPVIHEKACEETDGTPRNACLAPWGHSKGMVAWNDAGEGFAVQVTTPSWPASGSAKVPRKAGNILGCVANDNNMIYSQHFFR